MSSVAALRLRYELASMPAGQDRDDLEKLFEGGNTPTLEQINEIRERHRAAGKRDLTDIKANFHEKRGDVAIKVGSADNDLQGEDVAPDMDVATKGLKGVIDDSDAIIDGGEVEPMKPEEVASIGADATADVNMVRARQVATEWAPYLGFEEDTLLQAVGEGFQIHVFVNRYGGCLRTVRARFNLDKGALIFTRSAGDHSFVKIENLIEIHHYPKTIEYFKKLKGDSAVSPETQSVVVDTHHCIMDFKDLSRKKSLMQKLEHRGPILKFFFCFESEEDQIAFIELAQSYLAYMECPPAKVS